MMQVSFPDPAGWITERGDQVHGWVAIDPDDCRAWGLAPENAGIWPVIWEEGKLDFACLQVGPKPPARAYLTTEEGAVLDSDRLPGGQGSGSMGIEEAGA